MLGAMVEVTEAFLLNPLGPPPGLLEHLKTKSERIAFSRLPALPQNPAFLANPVALNPDTLIGRTQNNNYVILFNLYYIFVF